jgi:general secretion pathway protein H
MTRAARPDAGFTLIEVVCALAIVGLLAAVLLPNMSRRTSPLKLKAYAVETAGLLRTDRTAAMVHSATVETLVDARARRLRSGSSNRVLSIADDVRFTALLPETCNGRTVSGSVSFLASGMSCGGIISLSTSAAAYDVSINWLTGRIEIAAIDRTPQ